MIRVSFSERCAVSGSRPQAESCAAFVELKSSLQATEEELLDYCRAGLASFKVPRRVIFVNEWPMSGTGKIQKYVLRDSLWRPNELAR